MDCVLWPSSSSTVLIWQWLKPQLTVTDFCFWKCALSSRWVIINPVPAEAYCILFPCFLETIFLGPEQSLGVCNTWLWGNLITLTVLNTTNAIPCLKQTVEGGMWERGGRRTGRPQLSPSLTMTRDQGCFFSSGPGLLELQLSNNDEHTEIPHVPHPHHRSNRNI